MKLSVPLSVVEINTMIHIIIKHAIKGPGCGYTVGDVARAVEQLDASHECLRDMLHKEQGGNERELTRMHCKLSLQRRQWIKDQERNARQRDMIITRDSKIAGLEKDLENAATVRVRLEQEVTDRKHHIERFENAYQMMLENNQEQTAAMDDLKGRIAELELMHKSAAEANTKLIEEKRDLERRLADEATMSQKLLKRGDWYLKDNSELRGSIRHYEAMIALKDKEIERLKADNYTLHSAATARVMVNVPGDATCPMVEEPTTVLGETTVIGTVRKMIERIERIEKRLGL